MKILLLSDIHGNLSALNSVLMDAKNKFDIDALALLGDLIDYGMRSNEVIERIIREEIPIICNLWGNHEKAIMTNDFHRFSSNRGVNCAQQTKANLSQNSICYLNSIASQDGIAEFSFEGKCFLAIHGSLEDSFWKAITPQSSFDGYDKYDYVISGHSHIPHMFPVFYSCDNHLYRNKKRTIFINPGSVGQPRNHDYRAQYAVLDMCGDVYLCGVPYDVKFEQGLFNDSIDVFYRERLAIGV